MMKRMFPRLRWRPAARTVTATDSGRSESGDTLVEVLLALVILGLTSVALILAFSTSISASATQRQLSSANVAINDYAQNVIAGIESNQDLFTCPQTARSSAANVSYYLNELNIPTTQSTSTTGTNATSPTFITTITNIQYWNESTSTFSSTCASNAAQLVTVSVTPGSVNETTSFVVDSPSSGSSYVGGAPTGLTFLTPASSDPSITASSGASLPENPVVEVLFGNAPDATDLSPINLTLANTSGGATTAGTLSGCNSNDINGEVTYTGCTITLTSGAAAFTLVATDGTLSAQSGVINVTTSTASYLAFTTQPAAGNSGAAMTTQPVVKAYYSGTTTVNTSVLSITLTTSGNATGSPQLSSCSGANSYTTVSESNGIVTITDAAGHGGTFAVTGCDFAGGFYVDTNSGNVATPYTMTASSTNVISVTSAPFAVTGYGAAAQMDFVTEPTGGIATSTSSTTAAMNSFQVAVEDSWGNILSGAGSQAGYGGSVSAKIGATTLSCTPSSSQGIFTFSNCNASIGSNLVVTATATGSGSTGVATETSTTFNVTGPVSALVWYPNYPVSGDTAQPVAGASGSVMTNQPVLAYEDAGKNPGETAPVVVTADTTPVTFTSSYSSGTESTTLPNGLLTTCSNLPPVNGVVTAGNCTFVGLVGTNYTMQAKTTSGTTLTSPVSSTFSPTGPGPASQLVFTPSPGVEPSAGAAGFPFTTEPVVVVEDTGGNIVANASNQVEMNSYLYDATPTPTVQSGALSNCSTLTPDASGDVTLIPVSGYLDVEGTCAFGGVVGTPYQLVATASGLTSAVSTSFTPTTFGTATQVNVAGCSAGITWSGSCSLTASVQDAWGNTVASYNSGVTWTDAGGLGAVTGPGSSTAVNGVSSIVVTGTVVGPDSVTATAAGFTSNSDAFTVSPDSTTTTVSETPTSVTYGHESVSVFTVRVATGNGEVLPSSDSATVSVGGATCTAIITPSGTGGTGACSIGNSALNASASAYAVSATYNGDVDLQTSVGTAPTGLSVAKDTSSTMVSETPTSVTYGHESAAVFTVTVSTGHGEVLPSSDSATVSVGGATCIATITPSGSGGTGTCSLGNSALAYSASAYGVTATYAGDTDLLAAGAATAPTGVTVLKDSTTATVSESPTSVAFGHEATSIFTVTVVTGNREVLPSTDSVTVTVGTTSCVASVVPSGSGGSGTCSIANSALAVSATPYPVSAAYLGDADLTSAATANAATGLTVAKDTSTTSVSESPTSVTYGSESAAVFRVTVVTGDGEVIPSTDSSTVSVGGTTCTATITPSGSGGSGTCTIANSVLNASATAYQVTATYSGDADVAGAPTSTAATGLTVTKAAPPAITWTTPAAITYPTALSATQLTASDSLPGTFVYTPASGTVLTAGSQTLGVVFTPTSTNYSTASGSVPLTVNKDSSTATVSETPTSDVYGHEANTIFTVTVVTGGHEALPSTDTATVSVGGTTCTATITPSGTGGSGTCTIANNAVPVSGTAYAVQVSYLGDADISAALTATAPTGLSITRDTSTATVSVSPASSPYGSESDSEFTVTVVTGGHEVLPSTDNVVVNVGTASCTAAVAPSGTGGVGFCTITDTALNANSTAYSVTATYGGDTSVGGATQATASPGFTVTKFSPAVSITNTTNPTALGTGTLTLTATVAGAGTSGPTGTVTWTDTSSGKAFNTCTGALTVGAGSSTATCTVTNPTAGTYTSSVTYNGDTNDSSVSTSGSPFDLYIGGSSSTDLSTASMYYLINGDTAGATTISSSDYLKNTTSITITGITGIITPGFATGVSPTATFTVGQGQSTFSTIFSCSVTTANPDTTCTTTGSKTLASTSYLDLRAQELASSDSFKAMWIVTYTT